MTTTALIDALVPRKGFIIGVHVQIETQGILHTKDTVKYKPQVIKILAVGPEVEGVQIGDRFIYRTGHVAEVDRKTIIFVKADDLLGSWPNGTLLPCDDANDKPAGASPS